MGYLLLVSFIIHVITFVFIRQLKVELDKSKQDKEHLDKQQKEIEELLAVYLIEIREENEKLLETLNQNNHHSKNTETEEKNVDEFLYEPEEKIEPKESVEPERYQDYQPIEPPDQEDTVEQSLAAQVLSLHEKGVQSEEIAKQLNRGKREVELFIRFHNNETK